MTTLHFEVEIAAPRALVASTMLEKPSYVEWVSEFHPGSYFSGDWSEGSTIRFVAADEEGVESGLVARVAEHRAAEFVSLEYLGLVVDGADDTTSDAATPFVGTHENYTFRDSARGTTLIVDAEVPDEYADLMRDDWEKSLTVLTRLAETAARSA